MYLIGFETLNSVANHFLNKKSLDFILKKRERKNVTEMRRKKIGKRGEKLD